MAALGVTFGALTIAMLWLGVNSASDGNGWMALIYGVCIGMCLQVVIRILEGDDTLIKNVDDES